MPSPVVHRVLAGHFRERQTYGVLRPGGTSDWLLVYTIRGAGDFGYDSESSARSDGRIITAPGDAVLLRPATLHDYRTYSPAKRWDLLWAHFHPRPEWQQWLNWPAVSPTAAGLMRVSIGDHNERKMVERALTKMNDLALGSHPLSQSMAMNALEESLLWCAKQVLRPTGHDPRVEHAEAYLCQHLRESITLDDLALEVGVSVSRLSFLFKQHTGVTPQRYYEVHRLERARQLLESTSLPIKSIAAEVGFDNPFYFTLRFKKHSGNSPREYRKILARNH